MTLVEVKDFFKKNNFVHVYIDYGITESNEDVYKDECREVFSFAEDFLIKKYGNRYMGDIFYNGMEYDKEGNLSICYVVEKDFEGKKHGKILI